MLFWHVALLFSVLCTSVLASPDGNHETSQRDDNPPLKYPVTFEELQGCWVGSKKKHGENDVANELLAIQGGRIVYTTDNLAKKIKEDPRALDSTHWLQSLDDCGGYVRSSKRTTFVNDRLIIDEWSEYRESYWSMFVPANGDKYGGKASARFVKKNLKLGGIFKEKFTAAAQ